MTKITPKQSISDLSDLTSDPLQGMWLLNT